VNGAGTAGACYSFYATKNLTSGEGGALATDDPELADFARVFRLHGMSHDAWSRYHPDSPGGYDVVEPGIKGNLPDILATLARSQLARFDEIQQRRREIVHRYRDGLGTVPGLRCVPSTNDEGSADHLMIVELPEGVDRAPIQAGLSQAGISTSVHFQPLHHLQWFAKNASTVPSGLGVAENVAPRTLSLPLHSGMSDDDVDYVCDVFTGLLAHASTA
jgi:dTDP-4-amino-4,6-dideoxygalactose transaminase